MYMYTYEQRGLSSSVGVLLGGVSTSKLVELVNHITNAFANILLTYICTCISSLCYAYTVFIGLNANTRYHNYKQNFPSALKMYF